MWWRPKCKNLRVIGDFPNEILYLDPTRDVDDSKAVIRLREVS
jgi:hypothetical protein